MNINKSDALLKRAYKVIPSATQTFSKGPTQWVRGVSPSFLSYGDGAWVWDVDNNRYLDYVMALGSVTLGYGDSDIKDAVTQQIIYGANFSMMHPLEVEVAEKVTQLVPCAEMVRFGKNGSDATSAMVRVARAYTGRDRIAICGYHGWQDWYIGTTSRKDGVPVCVQELTDTFEYNNLESLERLLQEKKDEYALVILEPFSFVRPDHGFLEGVRELTKKHGSLLGFDEVITGFRVHPGGAQGLLGVTPDIASFGKGMANGLPLSCVAGKREIMKYFDKIFFSSTFGGEVVALAAANKFLDIISDGVVLNNIALHGDKLKVNLKKIIVNCGLSKYMDCLGHGSHWGLILTPSKPEDALLWRSYLIQECTKRGYLFFGSHNPTRAHNDETMTYVMSVYSEVLPLFAERLRYNDMIHHMEGKVIDPIFRMHK
jgi:glutamate-1-semialdehyde 2,1-aminomutase